MKKKEERGFNGLDIFFILLGISIVLYGLFELNTRQEFNITKTECYNETGNLLYSLFIPISYYVDDGTNISNLENHNNVIVNNHSVTLECGETKYVKEGDDTIPFKICNAYAIQEEICEKKEVDEIEIIRINISSNSFQQNGEIVSSSGLTEDWLNSNCNKVSYQTGLGEKITWKCGDYQVEIK